ncbi:hypothetical protein [Xenorhabdus entomophaga]
MQLTDIERTKNTLNRLVENLGLDIDIKAIFRNTKASYEGFLAKNSRNIG